MIELKNVSKLYGKKQNIFVALRDITLKIKDGGVVAIIGKSGSGKSTLMHAMSGLDPATGGVVKIGNKDLSKMSREEVDKFRSSYMSFIFQSFFVEANQTVLQNVMLPLEISGVRLKKRKALVEKALELVELSDKVDAKARNLSGGQKQRLAIARAIVNNPKLIFADEPTGNLDSKTGEKVTQILFDLNKRLGATLIIVTHDEDLAKKCDAQIHIKDGEIEKITGNSSTATYVKSSGFSIDDFMQKSASFSMVALGYLRRYLWNFVKLLLSPIVFLKWLVVFIVHYKAIPAKWRHTTDLLRRSSRSLKSAKARTILTALAISVGGFTLVLTLAAGNGLRKYTDQLVSSNFDPAEMIVGRDREVSNTSSPNEIPQEYDESVGTLQGGGQGNFQVKRVSEEDVAELRSLPEVEQVRENFQLSIRYITRPGQKKYTGSGEAYNPAQKPEVKEGALPESGDIAKGTVLIPDSYLTILGFTNAADAIGKEVQITVQEPFSLASFQQAFSSGTFDLSMLTSDEFKPEEKTVTYTIAGVTKKPVTSLSFGISPILLSVQDVRELYDLTVKGTSDYNKFIYVFVRVKGGQDENKLLEVKAQLREKGYEVLTSKDIQQTITQFVNILQIMVAVFGMITVVASIFGVVNTQYISVLERTREIGMMKALGMSRNSIYRLFKYEAAWIGFIGGLIGILLGLLLGKLVNPWLTNKLELGDGNSLLIFNVWQMLALLVALMMVAAVAGLLPARKAAKLDPVEALRTE